MAPSDDDGVDCVNFGPATGLQGSKSFSKTPQTKSNPQTSTTQSNHVNLDGEKAYATVANLEESDLRNLLIEVVSQSQSKNDKSAIAQFLIRKEEDALREESGSGEDTIDLGSSRHKKKRSSYKRDHYSCEDNSAASKNSTGGSLGSLHNITDHKVPEKKNTSTRGVASRSSAGGSCGNLSKGSFATNAGRKRGGRSKEVARASASQQEGGSLQNLNKEGTSTNDSKKLHKSGSLSQVFSDIGGPRTKSRRQKTTSESSSCRLHSRRSEDREADDSSEGDTTEFPYQLLGSDVVDGSGIGSVVTHWNEDQMSDVVSGDNTEDEETTMHISARNKLGGEALRSSNASSYARHHDSTELLSVVTYSADRDVKSDNDVDRSIQFSLSRNQEDTITTTTPSALLSYAAPCIQSSLDAKSSKDNESVEKKKLRSIKSDSNSFEVYCTSGNISLQKSSLDENGNPILMSMRNNISDRSTTIISGISRRNGYSNTPVNKDGSTYDRLKAKQDKKKANKEKAVIAVENVPGFCGAEPVDNLLKFLDAADDTSSGKSKKKGKGAKKDEEISKRRSKDRNEDDDRKKKLKKKKSSGLLRETTSMEDLVFKCKQEIVSPKQHTVDDGNLRSPYRSKTSSDHHELIQSPEKTQSTPSRPLEEVTQQSDFKSDFYKVGDAILESEPLGDFEVVSRKRGRRSKGSLKSPHRQTRGGSSHRINFAEAPRTPHEGTFRSWSGTPRAGGILSATTSAPHSEEEEFVSDDDSVHSMPAHTITPKPQVRIHPQSTDSTPQASYANIARLSSSSKSTNRKDEEDSPNLLLASDVGTKNENLLDQNFPPLSSTSSGVSSSSDPNSSDGVSPSEKNKVVADKVCSIDKNKVVADKVCSIDKNKVVADKVCSIDKNKVVADKVCSIDKNKVVADKVCSIDKNKVVADKVCSIDKYLSISGDDIVPSSLNILDKPAVPLHHLNAKVADTNSMTQQQDSPVVTNNHSANINNNVDSLTIKDSSPSSNCIISNNSENKLGINNKNDKAKSVARKCNPKLIMVNGNSGVMPAAAVVARPSRKYEAAVVFTSDKLESWTFSGIEFGFDETLDDHPPSEDKDKESSMENEVVTVAPPNNNKKDFSKLYRAPRNDDLTRCNYEELRKHVSTAWESTLRMMEEDPANIQYWQANPVMTKKI